MNMSDSFTIVLPSYLEEENLRLLLPRIKEEASQTLKKFEILVVDTIEKLDATEELCKKEGILHVRRGPTNSFGDAVRTGIKAAQGEWILFMDSDGSHSPAYIPKLMERTGEFDIVIASRYVEGGVTENDTVLIWMSRILNFTYSWILNLRCKDVSNSFKVYRASLLKELTLVCNNFDIIEEILYKICVLNKKVRILEIPTTFRKRMFGETKRSLFKFIFTYVFTMIKLRFLSIKK